MDSNTHSARGPARRSDGLAELTAAVDDLAAQDLGGLPDAVRAERVLELRGLLDRPRVCPDRPGPVPRPVGCDGPGVDRRPAGTRPCQRARRRHPRPGRPHLGRGRAGAGGGGPPPGPSPPAPGGRPSAPGARPDPTAAQAERRHGRRGLWLTATWEGMVAVDGRLEPEAGQSLLAALEPLARPAPPMRVVGTSVGPTPWPSWPAAASKAGGWPAT